MVDENPTNQKIDSDVFELLIIERFRSILSEKERVNRDTITYIRMYAAIVTGVFGFVFVGFPGPSGQNAASSVELFGQHLMTLLAGVGFFIAALMIINIVSWFDLRREEANVMNSFQIGAREQPNFANFWRWRETYMVAMVFFASATILIWRAEIVALASAQ